MRERAILAASKPRGASTRPMSSMRATPEGPRPAHIKDRIRALGPTVRRDLTLKPADPPAGTG